MTLRGEYAILIDTEFAGVVELVDTGDLKSPGSNTVPVRVRSPAPVFLIQYRGVEQLVARRAHNPEAVGSSPASATRKTAVFVKKTAVFATLTRYSICDEKK